jgi:transposase
VADQGHLVDIARCIFGREHGAELILPRRGTAVGPRAGRTLEADIPAGKIIHVVLDNYATHKHPKVRAWLARHPRFVFHFTPTSASWFNAVEGFFAKLARRRLKPGVFRSIVDLQAALNRFLRETNEHPKPFVWTADPDTIIAAVRRGYQTLESIH